MTHTLPDNATPVEMSTKPTRAFPFAEHMTRLAAADAIRRLTDVHDLPYPATVQFCPGVTGQLSLYVDTAEDQAAWLAALPQPPRIAGRGVFVYDLAPARERDAKTDACAHCGGEMTHRAGCPSEPEHLADHYAADPARCPSCDSPSPRLHPSTAPEGGEVYMICPDPFHASRVNPEAAEKLPVLVFDVPKPTVHLLHADWSRECGAEDEYGSISLGNVTCPDCLASRAAASDLNPDEPIPYTPIDPDAREYVPAAPYTPVYYPPGDQLNRATAARLRGETVHYVPEDAYSRGHVPPTLNDHGDRDVKIVEVTSVEPGPLDARDDNAVMAGVLPQQTSFAEAAERLETVRDAEVAEYAHAMLGEASGE